MESQAMLNRNAPASSISPSWIRKRIAKKTGNTGPVDNPEFATAPNCRCFLWCLSGLLWKYDQHKIHCWSHRLLPLTVSTLNMNKDRAEMPSRMLNRNTVRRQWKKDYEKSPESVEQCDGCLSMNRQVSGSLSIDKAGLFSFSCSFIVVLIIQRTLLPSVDRTVLCKERTICPGVLK